MNITMSLLSKHRSSIMFLAILWVIAFHSTAPAFGSSHYERIICNMGYGGVDIFLFLSGFGLCFNYYNQNLHLKYFYKRRLIRILPTYWFCIIFFGILSGLSIYHLCWQFTCIGFFIKRPYYDWYIPSLLCLYFIFPLYLYLSKKYGIFKITICFSFIGLLLTTIFIVLWKGSLILFTSRIPIFFIGCLFGYYNLRGGVKSVNTKYLILSIACLIIEGYLTLTISPTFMHKSSLNNLPFIIITPGLCLIVAKILDFIPTKIILPFQYLGTLTLEIYLCHMSLRFLYPQSHFLLPIICGIGVHYIIKSIIVIYKHYT